MDSQSASIPPTIRPSRPAATRKSEAALEQDWVQGTFPEAQASGAPLGDTLDMLLAEWHGWWNGVGRRQLSDPVRISTDRHSGPTTSRRPGRHKSSCTCAAATRAGFQLASAGPSLKRNLLGLREQKLLRQVFECLQDRFLCTFGKADWLEADERRVVGDQAVDASLNLFHLEGLLERLAQHP
jgi:hypothetical protein